MENRFEKLITRAGFHVTYENHFYYQFGWKGIRQLFGNFHRRQVIAVLEKV